jgi:hypothetical protein
MTWFKRKEETIDVTDAMLDSQKSVSALVKGLPEDELSMAWRSQLNLKLLEANDKKVARKRSLRLATLGSSVSLGAAAAVLGIMMFSPAKSGPSAERFVKVQPSELQKIHEETAAFASVSGTGSTEIETASLVSNDLMDSNYDLL